MPRQSDQSPGPILGSFGANYTGRNTALVLDRPTQNLFLRSRVCSNAYKTYTHLVVHDEESLTPGGTSEIHMWRGVAAVGVVDRPPADESLERCTGQDVASKLKALACTSWS